MKGAAERVRVVVLNFNGGSDTLRCFEHLRATQWPSELLELICVDNGSTDGSIEELRTAFPEVEVRALGTNSGFPANNAALRDLDGVRYVALVNNDAFVEPDWLAPLVDALDRDPGLGAVSPKLLLAPKFTEVSISGPLLFSEGPGRRDLCISLWGCTVDGRDVWRDLHVATGGWGRESAPNGTFDWIGPEATVRVPVPEDRVGSVPSVQLEIEARRACELMIGESRFEIPAGRSTVTFPCPRSRVDVINGVGSIVFADGCGADRGWLQRDDGQLDDPVEVFSWCGGGVLLRPAYLADVGLFDESFFLYYEDTDLSWRGQARGWRYRTVPSSVIRHVHAASSGSDSEVFAFHVERNRLLLLTKNAPARFAARQVLLHLRATASYAKRDIVMPVLRGHRPHLTQVRRRTVAFSGFLRMLPRTLVARRHLRSMVLVPHRQLEPWFVGR